MSLHLPCVGHIGSKAKMTLVSKVQINVSAVFQLFKRFYLCLFIIEIILVALGL